MTENIKKLTPYQHVRLKTEMYFSSRNIHTQKVPIFDNDFNLTIKEISWIPAIFTCFREILDNSLDEVLGFGYGDRIEVFFDEENFIFSVEDNGRGVPIDWDEEHKNYKSTMVFSEIMTGRNFDERNGVVGTNGIGASGVNFVSSYFKIRIHRDNKIFEQVFEENPNGKNLIIKNPKIKEKLLKETGTKVEFKLSDHVFKNKVLPLEFLYSRLVEICIFNQNLKLFFNNKQIKINKNIEKSLFSENKIQFELKDDNNFMKVYIVPDFLENEEEFFWSMVNFIPMFNGGIHVDKFKNIFCQNLIENLANESKKRKIEISKQAIFENCLVYIFLHTKEPNFDSQSKNRFINENINEFIKNNLNENFYKSFIRKNYEWIEKIYERSYLKNKEKEEKETNKFIKKTLKSKVPDLIDATSKKREETILFIAEGKSAIGGLVSARDPKIHGGLPLRGKIINVFDEKPKSILENQEISNIISAIGLNPTKDVDDIRNLRYGKVFIATDMDHDGNSITCLLINFFYKFWPNLFKLNEPYFYLFQTPYVILIKGKERKYFYSYNYDKFIPKDWQGWQIRRAKGLGTLTKEDWEYSLKNPIIIPITYDNLLEEKIDLLFNPLNADKRKEWMIK
ncbi:MAG: toprim domain-containing protein [Candidatus Dojkabacteria bacterium]|nr:toprim domain-containing protein [Candidatus Dojkabacteria bacterium]